MYRTVTLFSALSALNVVFGQQVGTYTAEVHPTLSWSKCTTSGGCTTQAGSVVIDANWRWVHQTSSYTNCYTGNTWDATICPDGTTCAENCALEGADYSGTYGITTSGNALTLKFMTTSTQTNIGSRVYLMASDSAYQIFKPNNQEISFDVDVSNLPCGLNGAVYFSEMSADGGMSAYPNNKAGAKYGTGYCDSQCPRDIKFINGMANVAGWTASTNDVNSGTGNYGTCCSEMDIWEANSVSAAYTPHPCSVTGQTLCTGDDCGYPSRYSGVCDPDGCDFNSYRMGNTGFYGPSKTVNTSQKFTIVTQFITADGTASGALTEIRRQYVQNGVVIANSQSTVSGVTGNSITDAFCTAQKTAFGDTNDFAAHGGITTMGQSLARGAVLVLSVWDDHAASMLWLDSDYPTTADASVPGIARGTCATSSGVPSNVESQDASASVIYSNIKFGDIGSTFTGTTSSSSSTTTTKTSTTTTKASSTTTTKSTTTATTKASTTTTKSTTTTTTTAAGATQTKYGQCGGIGYTGPTVCASGSTCTAQSGNAYYSQCL